MRCPSASIFRHSAYVRIFCRACSLQISSSVCILRPGATSQSQGKKRNPNEFHDITRLTHFVKKLVSNFTQVYGPWCNKGDNGKLVNLLYFVLDYPSS